MSRDLGVSAEIAAPITSYDQLQTQYSPLASRHVVQELECLEKGCKLECASVSRIGRVQGLRLSRPVDARGSFDCQQHCGGVRPRWVQRTPTIPALRHRACGRSGNTGDPQRRDWLHRQGGFPSLGRRSPGDPGHAGCIDQTRRDRYPQETRLNTTDFKLKTQTGHFKTGFKHRTLTHLWLAQPPASPFLFCPNPNLSST